MSQAAKQNIFGLVVAATLAAVLGFAVVHAARGEPLVLDPHKFYVTVELGDKMTDQQYDKLVYKPAGSFDTRDACIAWLVTKDPQFMAAGNDLVDKAKEAFGPNVGVRINCEQPAAPEPANKI